MIVIPKDSTMYINIAIAIFYVVMIFVGSRKGLIKQVISVVGLIISLFFALRYCRLISSYIHIVPVQFLPLQETLMADVIAGYVNIGAWFIVLFLVFKLIFTIIEKVVGKIKDFPFLKSISKLLGATIGFVKATIWIFVFCYIVNMSFFANGNYIIKHTLLGTIRDTTTQLLASYNIPLTSTDMINELYTSSQNLTESDKEAIEDWLLDQGFEQIDKQEKK